MHQRRDEWRNRLPEHVAMLQAALLERWWTAQGLSAALRLNISTVKHGLQVIAQQRYVFARRTTGHYKPREYRLFPEATRVRKA